MGSGRLAGLLVVALAAVACGESREAAPRVQPSPERDGLGRSREVQQGPLGDDRRVTLEEAEAATPYDLRIPPTTDETGELTGIWIDAGGQVAFVWSTDLTFYVAATSLSEREAAGEWDKKIDDEREEDWVATTTRGHAAIGLDGGGDLRPSSLTWIEDGLSLQFVAPRHSLEQLKDFAEAVAVED